jgi:AcrR family transcriptional regulator
MPRRPEQFKELREKSREKILSAALELFAMQGYDSTSIESIAKKAGISKGLVYNYYESKNDILQAIFEDVMQHGEVITNKYKAVKNGYERMRGVVSEIFKMIRENPEYMKLLFVISLQPSIMENTKEFTKEMYRRNQEYISDIYGELSKKDPYNAFILDALIDGIILNYIRYGSRYPIDALEQKILTDYCTPPKKRRKNLTK